MADLNEQIDELEKLAAESDLIARLAVDPKARCANACLANELRKLATQLRDLLAPMQRFH